MDDFPLGPRFEDALAFAARVHTGQHRKASDIPYVGHLLAVAAIVLEAGGDEDQAIAALLHDSLEDQPERVTPSMVTERFGPAVSHIVEACSDRAWGEKPPWRERKERYLAHLETADERVLLVSLADKLHNTTALRRDVERHGPSYLDRFNAGAADQVWYHRSLADVFSRRLAGHDRVEPLVADLRDEAERFARAVGVA